MASTNRVRMVCRPRSPDTEGSGIPPFHHTMRGRGFSTSSQLIHPSPRPPSKNDYDYTTMTVLLNGTHDISIGLQQAMR
jgi:hypothetical protein